MAMAKLLVMLLAPLATALSLQTSVDCADAMGCALGGQCVEGKCACSPLWLGDHCERLALGMARNVSSNGYRNASGASWGGSVIRADDGSYHMFVSFMDKDCSLASWKFNSVIHHAVSQNPDGPFTFKEVVFKEFAHNPTITRAPDGTYLLYHIGESLYSSEMDLYVKDCRLGSESNPEHSGNVGGPKNFDARIRLATAKSLDGPWRLVHGGKTILDPGHSDRWDTAVTNPAPVVLPRARAL